MSRKKKLPYVAAPVLQPIVRRRLIEENGKIAVHFGFDGVDLHANMDGNITNFQLQRLGQIWWNKFLSLIIVLPIILGAVYATFGFVALPILLDQGQAGAFCLGVPSVILTVYVIRETWYLFLLMLDIRHHQVRWVVGEAKTDNSLFYLYRQYLIVDRARFAVDPKETGCLRWWMLGNQAMHYTYPFKSGRWYTVYYVPHSKTIISAEVSRPEDFEARLEQSVITMGADGEIEVG